MTVETFNKEFQAVCSKYYEQLIRFMEVRKYGGSFNDFEAGIVDYSRLSVYKVLEAIYKSNLTVPLSSNLVLPQNFEYCDIDQLISKLN